MWEALRGVPWAGVIDASSTLLLVWLYLHYELQRLTLLDQQQQPPVQGPLDFLYRCRVPILVLALAVPDAGDLVVRLLNTL